MTFSLRKMIQWSVGSGEFTFVVSGGSAEFRTPDGQSLSMSDEQWRALCYVIDDSIPKVSLSRANALSGTPCAGQPWTVDLDKRLMARWNEGVEISPLAAEFGRTKGAIKSRLVKLGCPTDQIE